MYYLNSFLLYSVLGFIFESFWFKFLSIDSYSGFMIGPVTPVYGFGVLVILIVYNYFIKKLKCNNIIKVLLIFVICTILLGAVECIGGYILDKLLGIELWNYTDKKFNIGKYVCLEFSVVWGIFSVLFIYIIKPFMDRFIKKIPKKSTYMFVMVFIFDLLYVILSKFF